MEKNIQIKALNKDGIEEFREFIKNRINGNTDISIDDILLNNDYVEETPFKEIDREKKYKDRYDLAEYLYRILVNDYSDNRSKYGRENVDEYGKSVGLWSWFALVYFDQLYDPNNKKLKDPVHFIFAPYDGQRWYRHSVHTAFYLLHDFPKIARVLISTDVAVHGGLIESVLSRDFIMKSDVAMQLVNEIYSDPETGSYKAKSSNRIPADKTKWLTKSGKANEMGHGGIERFTKIFQRLKLTHHVQSLDSDMALDLMGDEFKMFGLESLK